MVTAGNEVELLTLLFFSVTILEMTLLVELCQSHPSSVISVSCNKCSYHHKSPLLIITPTTASNLWVLLSCCFSVFPFELMIRSFSSYRIYRCSSWSVSRSWAVSHSWIVSQLFQLVSVRRQSWDQLRCPGLAACSAPPPPCCARTAAAAPPGSPWSGSASAAPRPARTARSGTCSENIFIECHKNIFIEYQYPYSGNIWWWMLQCSSGNQQ